MRPRHLREGSSQGHDRLLRVHLAHQVDHAEAHHTLAADALRTVGWDHGSLVADVLRIVGSGLDSLAVDAREVGKEKCCGLGRSSAGAGSVEVRHSCAGELAHMSRAKAEDTGSVMWLAAEP